jgi:UDP-N-acetylmuramoyl-L-alanyl-D-glutamate--2,6-diaminopimelate ligase
MHLHDLLTSLPEIDPTAFDDVLVQSIRVDSRRVSPGALFVALRGQTHDGHAFLEEAVHRGAAAALGEQDLPDPPLPYIRVDDSRLALARLASAWHGHPSRRLILIGVTGTDGKTTTVHLLHHLLLAAGLRSGMITTVKAVMGEAEQETGLHVTTPDPIQVQGYLAQMVDAGLTHCILEATSHGLAQHRVSATDFDVAVVTNITHEHLDFHGSYESYREAKARLFRLLERGERKPNGPEKTAVLNADDDSFGYLQQVHAVRQVAYSRSQAADVVASEVVSDLRGVSLSVQGPEGIVELHSPLIGDHNVDNLLAAYSVGVVALGVPGRVAAEGLAALQSVPGRMEPIEMGQSFKALVDFAHTPNALKAALQTARRLTSGRVIVVFGSAGLRDREKRRLMAETSVRLADFSIFTAEDPRTESLDGILDEMAEGARSQGAVEGEDFIRVPDRGQALRRAVQEARKGDMVLACGKGHEQSMCFGETEHPWDDRTALKAALAELLGLEEPAMPDLPTSS